MQQYETFKDESAQSQGIDTGRYFVEKEDSRFCNLKKGDLLKIVDDDGSLAPKFERVIDGDKKYEEWPNLRYATQEEIDAVVGKEVVKKCFTTPKESKLLTYSQFLDYIKKHGATKARIADGYISTIIYEFTVSGKYLVAKCVDCLDIIFSPEYTGLFEIVEEDKPTNSTNVPPEGYTNMQGYTCEPQPIIKFNKSLKEKTMSIINNTFKSKENKAMEKFGLGTTDQLNERGRYEFVDYLFQNLPEQKKGFLEKIVEASKEEK